MPTNISPQKFQEAVQVGFKRASNFRRARLLFLRNYVGQYFDRDRGEIGSEPLNLIFNAVRIIVPNMVMNLPKYGVRSDYLPYREYAELLGLGLDYNAKEINLRDTLRRWVVDAIFCMGVLKTGLCESGRAVQFDGTDTIDPGTIYTEIVDLDDFTFAPETKRFDRAAWIGDRIRVPRQQILDSGLYNNDLIMRLPSSRTEVEDGTEKLSRRGVNHNEDIEMLDCIDLVEAWVRDADAIVTVPGSKSTFDDYLRVAEYYGPKEGPYTFLAFTPPVPNNPFPVAPVGIWNDLHILSNNMAKKIVEQADRQKDIVGYRPNAADDAQEVVDSRDGDAIKMDDPEGVKTFSFGGQQKSNEAHLQQLMLWFNMMSGNTEALGGLRENSATATQANILQANQSIGIEDMRDLVYVGGGEEARKRAWYLHTDPLIELPLIRRRQKPASFGMDQMTGQQVMIAPAEAVDEQIILTPEARQGDFLDFHFEIQPKSMSRLDPHLRLQRAMEFAIKIIPAAATAAQICMQMGVPFSFQKFVVRMAKEADIEWMDEVFLDPEFQMQMMQQVLMTPGLEGSKGKIQSNGQPAAMAAVPSPQQRNNQQAQQGAVPSQRDLPTNEAY